MDWACLTYTCLGESREEAWETLSRVVREGAGREPRPVKEGRYAVGVVDDCPESIQRYLDSGVTHIIITAKRPAEQIEELYETFAKEVLPGVR